ncbi:hypothetical protein [Acinetobacter rudis]|uniref:Uncharacterized protein n=1 Tax=Acinetobacter rudis TaxID=632955 RepID=A0AAW8JCV7_9GAMM|nr:hypothetical protein [Acinetobacter rudis]MDQ8937034.1 hypothetical protein [Acinetobacter rudis]MDQ9019239.1 hypothetical protein [Acinetobacter rudis]
MKANEFVKEFGIEEAQFLIDEWDGEATNWSLETGFVFVGKSVDTHMLCIETLKRLVESHDLVESLGGLEKAKELLVEIANRDHRYAQHFEKPALEKAIVDVEACQ